MMTVRPQISAEGPRAPDDVWDRYVRPAQWPQWSPQIRSVDYATEYLAPGTSGVVHGPAGLRVPFRIIDVHGAGTVRSWSWVVTAAGVELALTHTVESVPAGTRTGLTIEGNAAAIAVYRPLARLALHRLVH